MHTSTLAELVRREGIPDYQPIFFFRKEENRGVIEFTMPAFNETKPQMNGAEVFRRLEALQFSLGQPTNSVKLIRKLRRDRYPRQSKTGKNSSKRKK